MKIKNLLDVFIKNQNKNLFISNLRRWIKSYKEKNAIDMIDIGYNNALEDLLKDLNKN